MKSVRQFIIILALSILPMAAIAQTTIASCEYWIDGNFESAVAGKCADGIADLELDLSTLSKGVHSISIQAEDSRGVFGSPVCKFFVVPEPALAGNTIAAYEYWFNHGSRKRVEVEPVTLFTMSDVWIDIVDVVPNSVSQVRVSMLCRVQCGATIMLPSGFKRSMPSARERWRCCPTHLQ